MAKRVRIKKIPARKREIREIKAKKREIKGVGKEKSKLEKGIINNEATIDSGRFLDFIQQSNSGSPVLENIAVATNQRDLEQEVAQVQNPRIENKKNKLSYSSGSQGYSSTNPESKSGRNKSEYMASIDSEYNTSDNPTEIGQTNNRNISEREKSLTKDDFISMGNPKNNT